MRDVSAYVDESIRAAVPGLYVLASVVVPATRAEEVREDLRGVLRTRRPRFHWRDEQDGDRLLMAEMLAQFTLPAVVAVVSPMDHRRSERARRVCLTRLLWELQQRHVDDIVFETRQEHRDREDRAHVLHAQKAGHVSAALHYAFAGPLQEPLLWLPDLVAGAVAYARGGDHHYLDVLGADVAVVDAGSGT